MQGRYQREKASFDAWWLFQATLGLIRAPVPWNGVFFNFFLCVCVGGGGGEMASIVARALEENQIAYVRLTSTTRQQAILRFRTDPAIKVPADLNLRARRGETLILTVLRGRLVCACVRMGGGLPASCRRRFCRSFCSTPPRSQAD